ncbi:MAG: hypothetical protein VX756_07445 [Bacteroidota bacterium]|nr:hypothetical protein [Bacteroidota bacterium]
MRSSGSNKDFLSNSWSMNLSLQSLFRFLLLPVPLIHQSCEQSLPIPAWVDLGRHQSYSLLNANFL